MFKNYIKIAIRNLLKNKVYSLINISGLAIGLATCLLIILYVVHEWSYDNFHSQSERIYRVVQTTTSSERVEEQASTPFRLGPVLDAEFPELIEKSVRFFDMQEPSHTFLNREDQISFRENNFYFVDSTFFDVFSAELIRGNPSEALKNPLSLVISEELAEKYFGDENPIGQSLSYKGIREMTVTGVMKTWPDESHIDIDLVASFTSLNEIYARSPNYDQSWFWNPVWTYILLNESANPQQLESQLNTIADNYYYAYTGWPTDETLSLNLQPITDIHLYSDRDQEMNPNSSYLYIYILIAVAGFIVIIACINFMNLSTARSLERSREVGLRKVMGGYRQQLFYQFIGESFFVSFIAILFGYLLVHIGLPFFNELTGKELEFSLFQNMYTIPLLLLLTLFVAFLSGSYPAIFLSSFKPTEVLKGKISNSNTGTLFRKGLVTFQFTLSVILLIGTAVIFMQLKFIQEKDLGFDKNNVLLLPTKQNLISWEFDTFIEQGLTHAQIQSITGLGKIPGSEKQEYYRYVPAGTGEGEDASNLVLHVTHNFIETFDLQVLSGRNFSKDFPSDPQQSLLINREMLNQLEADSPEEALGEIFYYFPPQGERQTFTVIGVVENFNYSSLKKEIEPLVIKLVEGTNAILRSVEHTAIEIAPGNPTPAIEHLESIWKELNPIDPFEYRFLDERLNEIYEAELTMSSLASAFSILCIIIACLGLLGLASYSAQLKKKEIGIRKSLGASMGNIISLLSKEFLLLVGIANLIAWPLTYYAAARWLENFPYRFDLASNLPGIFLGAAAVILIIALATVSYHSIKAAMINPVEAIRNE
ncbi:MAG: ABC transporter permease [Gracilimonas sp.]|uniref:ABC transporter permease n=1 Tax=Gracilimonas sp. TaxID=1974203 RepID=UPI0019CDB316|nr:ABC transporter permease [Gracilimonas sp.]MBD3616758.1 ABC transporter permease [Gracilimonas sp.]